MMGFDPISYDKAEKARKHSKNVQEQLNQAIAAGEQLVEVQQARTVNLFNKEDILLDGYYSPSTGEWVDDDTWVSTKHLPMRNGTYEVSNYSHIAKWDRNKTFLRGGSTTGAVSVREVETFYVTFGFAKSRLETYMITDSGKMPNEYVPYYEEVFKVSNALEHTGEVEPERIKGVETDTLKRTVNLFDKDSMIVGGFYDISTGNWVSNSDYAASDFIPVDVGEIYRIDRDYDIVFWDNNKNYRSGGIAGTGDGIAIPGGVSFVTFSGVISEMENTVFSLRDEFPNEYVPYYEKVYKFDDRWEVSPKQTDVEVDILKDKVKTLEGTYSDHYTKPIQIELKDFSGYNQPYHPSVVYIQGGFNGYKYWMVQSPYPSGGRPYRARWEVPIVYKSNNGEDWITVADPLDDLTNEEIENRDYMSDPHMVYREDTQTLEVWYRLTRIDGDDLPTRVLRKTTTDGDNWTEREELIPEELTSSPTFVRSPSIIWDNIGKVYRVWFTNGSGVHYNELPDNGTWDKDATQKVSIDRNAWHIDVAFHGGLYHYLGYFSSNESIVHYTSADGLSFQPNRTILSSDDNNPIYSTGLYRSCSLLDEHGQVRVYFSGMDKEGKTIVGLVVADSFDDIVSVRKIDSNKVLLENGMTLEELAKEFFALKASLT